MNTDKILHILFKKKKKKATGAKKFRCEPEIPS